jgi:ribose transport system permease protein
MKRSEFSFYKALGFILAILSAAISMIIGAYQDVNGQLIIFYGLAIFALVLWVWHFFSIKWTYRIHERDQVKLDHPDDANNPPPSAEEPNYFWHLVRRNRAVVTAILAIVALFIVVSLSIDGFFSIKNIISLGILFGLLILAYVLGRYIKANKSAFIGLSVLIGLFIIGSLVIDGFSSTSNLKSMLLFAAFLGLACIGQTLVALLGGLDLSIPFVIGSSNVGLLYIISLGVPPWLAFIAILLLGIIVGFINGMLSFRLQGQALIVTLGIGFAISGGTQIISSMNTAFGGNVFGVVPDWLVNIATLNGSTFGLRIPPVIVIWLLLSIALIFGLKNSSYGRNLYALGGSRTASERLLISERAYWVGAYMVSGFFSTLTGSLLLGWSGGGFIGVGDPYMFMTLAAVVVGGTSLLGGWGGYGFTVIGVLVLQVITSFLVGIGLSFQAQQFVFGLLILPMVAIYGRSPHIRTQI